MSFLINPSRFIGLPDPHFANVSLLLHCNGTNGSTSFPDNSPSPKTVTAVGNAQISTSVSKFGGGSGVFDGSGDYLTTPDSATFDFGSGDFTVEAWIYPTASPSQPIIIGQWSGSYAWAMQMSNDSNRYLRGLVYNGGFVDIVSSTSLSLNTWNHCAFVRTGNTGLLFLDGIQVASSTISGTVANSTNSLSLGADSGGGQPFQGNLNDIRVTKGVARYTSNFTPPTVPFQNS